MESNTKSFLLQTPFNKPKAPSVFSEASQASKVRKTNTVKSSSYAGEGSFADVIEYNRHLTALRDLEKLKNQYYEDYVEKLERKVFKQRKSLQQKDAETDNTTNSVHKSPTKTPKLPYHRLHHDREYMQKVTKSRFYHLLAARDLMQNRGLLKNRSDEDNFWDKALHDDGMWSHPIPSGIPADTMTRVMANRFSSMSTYKKQGQKDQHRVTFGDSSSGINGKNFENVDDDDPDIALDRKLRRLKAKIKLPKLHSLRNISPLPPIIPRNVTIPDTEKKLRRLDKLRSIKHAYDIAMVHNALTKSVLREHDLLPEKDPKFLLHDILPSIEDAKQHKHKEIQQIDKTEKPLFITEPVYGNDQVLIPDLEYKYASGHTSPKKNKFRHKSCSKSETNSEEGTKEDSPMEDVIISSQRQCSDGVIPLNYSMMLNKGNLKVRESKSLSSMWVNYIEHNEP